MSSVTVDKADIATLTAALAAAQDRLNAANEAANVAFRNDTDFTPAIAAAAIAAAEQCEAAGARAQAAAKSLYDLEEWRFGPEEYVYYANKAHEQVNEAVSRLRNAIQPVTPATVAVNNALSSVHDATAYANKIAAKAEEAYRVAIRERNEENEELQRQNRENDDKIAVIRNILDKAMNFAHKIKEQTNILDNHPPTECDNYSIRSVAINNAAEAAKDASILFASFVEKFKELGVKYSVFTKPIRISDMLCVFLGVPPGSLMSRSEVTKRVCDYAKTHNLLDKQVIRADPALRMLLSLTPDDELRILNLQHFLKPHYLRA
jgi:chromatin remodeling complex protein RSC6